VQVVEITPWVVDPPLTANAISGTHTHALAFLPGPADPRPDNGKYEISGGPARYVFRSLSASHLLRTQRTLR